MEYNEVCISETSRGKYVNSVNIMLILYTLDAVLVAQQVYFGDDFKMYDFAKCNVSAFYGYCTCHVEILHIGSVDWFTDCGEVISCYYFSFHFYSEFHFLVSSCGVCSQFVFFYHKLDCH